MKKVPFLANTTNTALRVSQMGLTGGGNLDKMAKNFVKMTKSAFWGQNSGADMGGGCGSKPIFQAVGGIHPSPPTRGNSSPKFLEYGLFLYQFADYDLGIFFGKEGATEQNGQGIF